jgi:hypothetical protein
MGGRRLAFGRMPVVEEIASDSLETEEYERPRVFGEQLTYAATRGYLLRNASASGAWVYCGGYKAQHGYSLERFSRKRTLRFQRLGRVDLASNFPGSNFFGTFLLDEFPLALIQDPNSNLIVLENKAYEHEAGNPDLFGLQRSPAVRHAQVGE